MNPSASVPWHERGTSRRTDSHSRRSRVPMSSEKRSATAAATRRSAQRIAAARTKVLIDPAGSRGPCSCWRRWRRSCIRPPSFDDIAGRLATRPVGSVYVPTLAGVVRLSWDPRAPQSEWHAPRPRLRAADADGSLTSQPAQMSAPESSRRSRSRAGCSGILSGPSEFVDQR